MSTFISNILDKLSKKFWVIIAISAGCFTIPIGFGVASLLVRSSSLSYESGDTKINVGQVKKISNEVEYANKILPQRLMLLEEEIAYLKNNSSNDPEVQYHIQRIEKSLSKFKPTVSETINNSEELKELVEDAIE